MSSEVAFCQREEKIVALLKCPAHQQRDHVSVIKTIETFQGFDLSLECLDFSVGQLLQGKVVVSENLSANVSDDKAVW